MTTIAEVRADLALVLAGMDGWTVQSGYVTDMAPHPYSFVINRPAFDPRLIFGQSKSSHIFTVTAHAPRSVPEEAQQRLDALCELSGTGSLIATVQTSSNWTITVDYAQVIECGEVQLAQWTDSSETFACPFQIEVVW